MKPETHPRTPDGRYFVVRGRLWRLSDPALDEATRAGLVGALMAARRAVQASHADAAGLADARARVDAAKRALGERGPVWWTDGTQDFNRHMAVNTPYAAWYAGLAASAAGDRGDSRPRQDPAAREGHDDPGPE